MNTQILTAKSFEATNKIFPFFGVHLSKAKVEVIQINIQRKCIASNNSLFDRYMKHSYTQSLPSTVKE